MKTVTTISIEIELMQKLNQKAETERKSKSVIIEEALKKTYGWNDERGNLF